MNRRAVVSIPLRHPAEGKPVPIVSDAVYGTQPVSEGAMVPLLILDTTERPDISDMISAHRYGGQGDVKSVWAAPSRWGGDRIRLVLTVVRPSHCVIVLEFEIVRQGGLVDQIVQTELLYLQAGRPGDRLISTLANERVILEVPSREFRAAWDSIFRKALV